jgi:hypothetical protein
MNLAYGVVLKLIESSEGRLVLKLYKLMMHLPLLQWMDLSTLMYQKLEQSPMLLGMLLDLDHEGPNPENYLERHNLVDHDQEKHKLDQDLYMRLSKLLQLMLQWLLTMFPMLLTLLMFPMLLTLLEVLIYVITLFPSLNRQAALRHLRRGCASKLDCKERVRQRTLDQRERK